MPLITNAPQPQGSAAANVPQTPAEPPLANAPQPQPAPPDITQTPQPRQAENQTPPPERKPTIPAIAEQPKEEESGSLTVLERSLLDEMHKRGEITKEEKDRIEREAGERKKLRPKAAAKPRVTHVKRTAVRHARTRPSAEHATAARAPSDNEETEGAARGEDAPSGEGTQPQQNEEQAQLRPPVQTRELPPAASRKRTAPPAVLEEAPLPQTPMDERELAEIKAAELPRETQPQARPRIIPSGEAQAQTPQQPQPQIQGQPPQIQSQQMPVRPYPVAYPPQFQSPESQPQIPYRQAAQQEATAQNQPQQTSTATQPQAQPRQMQAALEGTPGPRVVEERDYSMLLGRRPLARGEMVNGRPIDYQSELERRKREQASRDALPLQPGIGEPLAMDEATAKQREVELAIKIDEENRRKRSLVSKIRGLLHI